MDIEAPRDREEALLDLRYHIRLHFLHVRLYRRLRAAAAFISLVTGSAAVAMAIQTRPKAIFVCGIVIAAMGAFDIVLNWSDRAARHDACRRRFLEVARKSASMDETQLTSAIDEIEMDCDDEVQAVANIAYNDNSASNGKYSQMKNETLWQRAVRLFAA